MNVRRHIPTAVLAGASVLGVLTLSACSGSGGGKADGKLNVTASFYPMEFLAQEIGKDHVQVTDLTKPGTEPHDLELSPRQTAELGESDAIVYLKGVQPAVDKAVQQSGVKHTVDAASLTKLKKHGSEVDGHDHTTGDNGTGHDEHGHEATKATITRRRQRPAHLARPGEARPGRQGSGQDLRGRRPRAQGGLRP